MGIGYIILSLTHAYFFVIAAMAVSGLGFGLLMPNVNVWVVSIVSDTIHGKAVGGLANFFLLGQFVSPLHVEPMVREIGMGRSFGVVGAILLTLAAVCMVASLDRISR